MVIFDNWLLIALLGSFFYAVVNVIDCYFVTDVYHSEYDGTVISAAFQIIPLLIIIVFFPSAGLVMPAGKIAFLAVLGGLFFTISSFFYFKAMFVESDASIIEAMFSLSMFLVPILAYFLIGESLSARQYAGIAIAFVGINLPIINRNIQNTIFFRVFKVMTGAIIFLALSLIIEEYVYQNTGFANGYVLFTLGAIGGGMLFFLWGRYSGQITGRGLLTLNKKYFVIFVIAELLAVAGITLTQRALDKSPAASLVAMIDGLQPLFVILITFFLFVISRRFFSKQAQRFSAIHALQSRAIILKIFSIVAVIAGIYLIT